MIIADTISEFYKSDRCENEINGDKKTKSAKNENRKTIKPKNLLDYDFSFKFQNAETSNELSFFTAEARSTFTELKQIFIKASIFCHFDLILLTLTFTQSFL